MFSVSAELACLFRLCLRPYLTHSTCYNENMKSPFPGMDPYLEHHALWPDVHNRLIASIADFIAPEVAPNYYVRLESRAYIVGIESNQYLGRPDVAIASPIGLLPTRGHLPSTFGEGVVEIELPFEDEVNHFYLELRSVQTHELITMIEVLSPVNKIDARGRKDYERKRYDAMMSLTNYIEIDLLRAGRPMPSTPQVASDYRIMVKRGWTRRKAYLHTFNLQSPIPDIPLPLQKGEDEPTVPLNQIFHDMYRRARFDLQVDYSQPAVPSLTDPQQAWAEEQIAAHRQQKRS